MNTKFKSTKSIGLLAILLFSLMLSNGLQAQSLKKTFKYIKEGEIAKADIEAQEFTQDKKTSLEDLMLHGLSGCLLICNENYKNYDPYKSLELFNTTSEINADKAEVDKFLVKYELSIYDVHRMIYKSIFSQAQKINTEKSFQRALSVCEGCYYNYEAITLKENCAYNEAKSIKSVDSYKYFIRSYPISEHRTEIQNLLYELAFQNAKSKMSLLSMNDYLKEYSNKDNKFEAVATHLRDSIAFSTVSKSYVDYLQFSKQYPKSEYSRLIKQELPDLLYNEAVSTINIEQLELFLKEYPTDIRVDSVNAVVEFLVYENLKQSKSSKEFEKFKNRFPNSLHIAEYNQILAEDNKVLDGLKSNSDLKKYGLLGKVKSIETLKYSKPNFDDGRTILKEEYNELGYLTYFEGYDDEKIVYTNPNESIKEFDDTKILQLPNKQSCITPIFNLIFDFNTVSLSHYRFEYNDEGLLSVLYGSSPYETYVKCIYKYDANRNLNLVDIFEKESNYPYDFVDLKFKIKYNWSNGLLISKQTYYGDGRRLKFIDYEYQSNKINAKILDSGGQLSGLISLEYDQNKLPVKIIYKKYIRSGDNIYLDRQEISDFYYSQNKLSDYSYRQIYTYIRENRDITSKYQIDRDSKGMIKSIYDVDKQPDYFSEYKYDSYGNWIEITDVKIIKNDIEIKTKVKVIKRKITYYE